MEEIGEEEIFEDFAEALQLRPLERRQRLPWAWSVLKRGLSGVWVFGG